MADAFRNKLATAGTSATTVYTCPAATTAIVRTIRLCNTGTNPVTVSVTLTDTSAGVTNELHSLGALYPVGGESIGNGNEVAVLEAGDIIKASASEASVVKVTLAVLEIT